MTLSVTVNLASSATQYYAGNTIGFVAAFADSVTGPVNPVDTVFTLTNPYGGQANYSGTSLQNGPAGTYGLSVLCNVVGVWHVRAACSNPAAVAASTTFNIVAQVPGAQGTIPESLDQVASLPLAGTLTGTETLVAVQGNNPVQMSAAQFAALISPVSATPPQAAGYPAGGGFWVDLDGAIRVAPVADLTRYTYPNVAALLLLTDDL